jgi:EAL domain-containing protein (putative c-di-GMP-specific phosphodiesterase class I)/ActR/RegA family two-component response regulator
VGDDRARLTARGPAADPDAALFAEARVLVVDDREANVLLLQKMLRSAGISQVEGVTDPRDAIARCLAFEPDVLLLDLHMPHMTGIEVLDGLQVALPAGVFLPVVVLTADITPDAKQRALGAGAKDFLTKPLDRVEVVLRVRNLLETRALYTRLQEHHSQIRSELDRRIASDEHAAAEDRQRAALIDEVSRGNRLNIVFQPIVELHTSRCVGFEALARFATTPYRPPDEWFAEAAAVGRGAELELLAIDRALENLASLPGNCFLSLNVSPAVAATRVLHTRLAAVPGARIVLELTEHERIVDYEALRPWLDDLRSEGVRIAVDDAGAGYAGLQQIVGLQPDIVKLDLELTRGINDDPVRRALARCLVSFADEIGAVVLAEGVETLPELEVLRGLGVPWGQGYFLGEPAALTIGSQTAGAASRISVPHPSHAERSNQSELIDD